VVGVRDLFRGAAGVVVPPVVALGRVAIDARGQRSLVTELLLALDNSLSPYAPSVCGYGVREGEKNSCFCTNSVWSF
jgi:hypothetical protein